MSQPTEPEGPEGLIVFRCRERAYRGLEVLQAADFRGEVEPVRKALLEGFARSARADELDLEVSEESLDALTEPFRYERNLISAEETERWLEERRLTLDDYEEYFRRRHWRSATGFELDGADSSGETLDPDEIARLLTIDLQMSGELHPMAQKLAWRLAALAEAGGADPPPEAVEEERRRFYARSDTGPSTVTTWLARLGCDYGWLEELLRMEAVYRRRCERVLTPDARERMLRLQRLELVRFEVELLDFDSVDAAHEAYLCAAEDGMSFREIAGQTRYTYTRGRLLVHELADGERQRLLSAKPGEVLPPTSGPELFQLWRVLDKIEPSVDDEEIRARIDDLLVRNHFAGLASRHVQWLCGGDVAE